MGFAIVILVSVAVGMVVYRLTERAPDTASVERRAPQAEPEVSDTGGWASEFPPRSRAGDGPDRVQLNREVPAIPVVRTRPSWHSRLNGAMGLVVAVGFGAIAIAFALYALGSFLVKLIDLGSST